MDLETRIEAVIAGDGSLADWALGLDDAQAAQTLCAVEELLRNLPVPLRTAIDGADVRRRRALERMLGQLHARSGRFAALLRAERVEWLRGGSHVSYLQVLVRGGRGGEAAVLARTLLAREACPEREALEEFVAGLSSPPEDWEVQVARVAEEPTAEAWDALFRFTPTERLYERMRYTMHLLLRLGVEPDHVFRLAVRYGANGDLVGLIEEGRVDPKVIEEHAETSRARSLWLGLAARAACVRGDRLGTVRLLRAAHETLKDEYVRSDLEFFRENADSTLREMLARVGIDLSD